MKKIITVIGTRPEIIKMSALLPKFDSSYEHYLVHSGQHYSPEMDQIFFKELALRQPDINLMVSGQAGGRQVGDIINKLSDVLCEIKPDAVVVHGDTNTTLAGAVAVKKNHEKISKLIHIEAGARSGNLMQQEELNRVIVDRLSDLLFASSSDDFQNLTDEGVHESKCRLIDNTIIEVCSRASKFDIESCSPFIKKIQKEKYIILTIHRQETVEDEDGLRGLFFNIGEVSKKIKVVFPIHPRTKICLDRYQITVPEGVTIIDPVGYFDMVQLLKNSLLCITDSGGIQEEASFLKVPTLVVRNETEYVRYVNAGILKCIGSDGRRLYEEVCNIMTDDSLKSKIRNLKLNFNENVSDGIIFEMNKILNECN